MHDLRVTFDAAYRIQKVRLQPDGKELEMRKTDTGISVVVPRLDVHAMVVAELDAE